jgi:hypothetical protein
MENKELQNILREAFNNLPDIKQINNGGNFDIVKLLSSFSKIPSYIEKDIEENPDKYPVESRDMIIKEIEELKRKATPEYVYQELAKHKENAV